MSLNVPSASSSAATPRALASETGWLTRTRRGSHRVLDAALEAFAVTGYHGTTTRDIAARAGMSPAAVYIRFESKADLLAEISVAGHADVLAQVVAAVAEFDDPRVRLDGIVRTFVDWHATNSKIARVIEYELHALEPEAYERVAKIRQEMSRLFRALVRDALDSQGLDTADLGLVTRAIISMGVDVARWYTPGSQPTPAHIAGLYAALAFKMLGLAALPIERAGPSDQS